jgi:GIY-YIG catalytic domain
MILEEYRQPIDDINCALNKFKDYFIAGKCLFDNLGYDMGDSNKYTLITDKNRDSKNWVGELIGYDQPGVYFIFASKDSKAVAYIGKASMKSKLNKRFDAHYNNNVENPLKFGEVKVVTIIPLINENVFLAPSLEEFLINKLSPKKFLLNKHGNSYQV